MRTYQFLLLINYVTCAMLILHMIFVSKKKPERIAAWTFFMFIPFVGLLFYILIGGGLNYTVKRMISKKTISSAEYDGHIKKQIIEIKKDKNPKLYPKKFKDLILLNLNNCDSIFTTNNNIEYFLFGEPALEKIIEDIKNAQTSIHLQSYIFANDKVGKQVRNLLIEKAKQGVEVRVLYDAIGSLFTSKAFFKKLKKAGGLITQFFPPFLNIKLFNLQANYRNHRKILVIDGKIGYTGGLNFRDDHLGRKKSLSPWRDTHVRIIGDAVYTLQNIFLSDWRYSIGDKHKAEYYINEKYFPQNKVENKIGIQVLSSGPDNTNESIKECMIKMIVSAKKKIRIQSPYFIPDDTFMGSLKLALLSGVEVEIMIPKKVDHWSVHFASMSYINDVIKMGAKVYIYNGFIHSKTLMIDDEILTLGSCNIDIRSFSLNFEDNIVIYDYKKVKEYSAIYNQDIEQCSVYNEQSRKSKNIFSKILTSICRLFSAIL